MISSIITQETYSKFLPFLDKYERCMYVDWHTNNICNYKCLYCAVVNYTRDEKPPPISVVVDSFDRIGNTLIINMAGGESFLYPRYVDLCQMLTRNHYISINTNLSTSNVYEFADKVNPAKVLFITASVHILEREKHPNRLKEYIDKILYLQARKFNVIASYVAHPLLLPRIVQDFEFLRNAGVSKMEVGVFEGMYRNLSYPQSYSEDERKTITSLGVDCDDRAKLFDLHSFCGHLCTAGINSFSLHSNGRFYRCNRSERVYGDLFCGTLRHDFEPRPCPFTRCCVPSFGILSAVETKAEKNHIFFETFCEAALRYRNRALSSVINPSSSLKKLRTRLIQSRR